MRATIASIPSVPTIGRGHGIEYATGSVVQYLRDTQGNLILDTSGQPIQEVDQT